MGDRLLKAISIAILDVADTSWGPRHGLLHAAVYDVHLVDARAGAHGFGGVWLWLHRPGNHEALMFPSSEAKLQAP